MKNKSILMAIVFLAIIAMASCRKEDSAPQGSEEIVPQVSLKLSRRASNMHIYSVSISAISGPTKNQSCGFCAYLYDRASIKVVDASGYPVSGVTVTGTFSGCYNFRNAQAVTDANGIASINGRKGKSTCSVTFTVTNLTSSTFTYNSSANVTTSATYTPPSY